MSSKLSNLFASECMAKLYLQSDSADIHFAFPNLGSSPSERVPAHKLLLATASPVFKAMFNGNWNENETVDITDSNASAFKELLQFIYLPEVTLTIGNIEEVVRLADKYDMLECFETCAEFLQSNLTIENMVWGYQLAITLNNAQLMAFCEKHIQIRTDEILRSDMFLHFSREVIDHILKLNTIQCDEIELFNACIEWAKASCQKDGLDANNSENLKNQLGPCFRLFRFGAMKPEEIADILQSKVIDGMFTKDELADIWRSKWAKESTAALFNHQARSKPSYEWNAEKRLVCNRSTLNTGQSQSRYIIQQQESTWLSTNELVLLGQIYFFPVQHNGSNTYLEFRIEIIEHAADDFTAEAPTKQLYANMYGSNFTLLLAPPVLIRPTKLYEIRLHPTYGVGSSSHTTSWGDSVVNLDDKIAIKFHQNPLEISSDRRGLVSSVYFNRIE